MSFAVLSLSFEHGFFVGSGNGIGSGGSRIQKPVDYALWLAFQGWERR